MKKLFILIATPFFLAGNARSQGTAEYTNATMDWVSAVNDAMYQEYKDQYELRRIETGTLKLSGGLLTASTERKLFSGATYFIGVASDNRAKNIKLNYYKLSNNKWELLKTEDENTEKLKKVSLLGDNESMVVSPTETTNYKFEIEAANQNGAGRYTIMIWSKNATTPAAAKPVTRTIYKVDSYSVAEYQKTSSKYGDFGKDTPYVCSFEINAGESSVRQTSESGSLTVYDIQEKKTDSASWIQYSIRSPDGKRYAFWVPKESGKYIRVFKIDGNDYNALTDYHITSKVAE